jgi:uncharacterized membrane protein/uncharacterized membrane protein YeaQ/YmgE (transglycosylase-associated protein family)
MEALIWLAAGTLSGWAAGKLMKGRDYGVTGNIILGMLGSLVGGWVFDALGFAGPKDIWRHIAVSLLGAMLTLAVARRLRPVARQTRKAFGEGGTIVDIEAAIRRLGSLERSTLDRVLKRAPARDPNVEFAERMTFGQRVADKVAQFGGSWTFIGTFLLMMVLWMILNGQLKKPFDPYPFILLNLCLSCVAALQAPVIMMSQNRQAAKDRLMATNDYEVNLRSELALQSLHSRFDELRERDWSALVEMQKRQIELLEGILRDVTGKDGGKQ